MKTQLPLIIWMNLFLLIVLQMVSIFDYYLELFKWETSLCFWNPKKVANTPPKAVFPILILIKVLIWMLWIVRECFVTTDAQPTWQFHWWHPHQDRMIQIFLSLTQFFSPKMGIILSKPFQFTFYLLTASYMLLQ